MLHTAHCYTDLRVDGNLKLLPTPRKWV